MTPTKPRRGLHAVQPPPKEQTYAVWLANADKEIEKALRQIKVKGEYLSPNESKANTVGTVLEIHPKLLGGMAENLTALGKSAHVISDILQDLQKLAIEGSKVGVSAKDRQQLLTVPARIIKLSKGLRDDMNVVAAIVVEEFEGFVEDDQ